MKRQIQESGERKWYGNDHIIMQNELWTAIESFFEPYGCAILKGCQINADNDKWTITAGIVGLYAPDKSEYRVCKLQETSLPVSTPVAYLSLQSREETEEYLTGGVKPILKEYYAEVSTTAPSSGEYLAIKKDGNNTSFRKAFQDATARMVTDAQIQSWNTKEPSINKKSGFNLDKSDSTSSGSSDVLATSKAVSTAKSEVISEVQGGVSSSYNTLLKLYNWVLTQLGLKAPTNHASTEVTYGVATSSNYGHSKLSDSTSSSSSVSSGVSATPKAVNDARLNAITTVQGGASSGVNTLKKLYDWAVGQLGGKAPKSHASTSTGYGLATSSNYGHAKASSATPRVAGSASVGTDNGKYAREDHVHPAQTSVDRAKLLHGNSTFYSTGQAGVQYHDGDFKNQTTTYSSNDWNAPTKAWWQILHMPLSVSGYYNDLALPVNSMDGIRWRQRRSSTYFNWLTLLDSSNYTKYAAPKSHASTSTGYGVATSSNYGHVRLSGSTTSTSPTTGGYAATPKAVNDARQNAITTVQGGASSGVNTLKKLYDWAVGQLNGKEPKITKKSGFNLDKSDSVSSGSSSVLATSKAVNSVRNLINGNPIPSGYNLNNVTTPGNYYCHMNNIAVTLANCPTSNAFSLEVKQDAGFIQILRCYLAANNLQWYRNYYSGTWTGWTRLVTRVSDSISSTLDNNTGYAATPKAVNDARQNAITTVQGGASSGVNTLKKLYDWAVAQLNGKVSKSGDVMTGSLLVKKPGQTNGAMVFPSIDENNSCIVGMAPSQNATPTNFLRVGSQKLTWTKEGAEKVVYNAHQHPMSDSISSSSSTSIASSKAVKTAYDKAAEALSVASDSKLIGLTESSGNYRTALGNNAEATYSYSTAIGCNAKGVNENSVALGFGACASGINSIAIGRDVYSGYNSTVAIGLNASARAAFSVALGYNSSASNSSQIVLGNSSSTVKLGSGSTVTSDKRQKIDIEDLELGLSYVNKLSPKKYRYNHKDRYYTKDGDGKTLHDESGFPIVDLDLMKTGSKAGKRKHFGLIAQDVESLNNELGLDASFVKQMTYNDAKEGRKPTQEINEEYGLDYAELIPVLIKAIQELSAEVKELKEKA